MTIPKGVLRPNIKKLLFCPISADKIHRISIPNADAYIFFVFQKNLAVIKIILK
jgi:hypothetical protein